MRILILSASFPPILGGLETAVHALACAWQDSGHQVQVVTQRHPRRLAAQEIMDGLPVWRRIFLTPRWEYLQRRRPDLFLGGLYYGPATQHWLRRKLSAFRPQVVNLHFPDAQIPFVLRLRERCSFRLVVSLHGHDVMRWTAPDAGLAPRPLSEKQGLCRLLQAADAVTACSADLLEQAIRLEPAVQDKGAAIPNGIDLARFQDHTVYAHPRPYLLAVGRLVPKKGFDLLIEAFAQYAKKHPNLDLLLAGAGETASALLAQAAYLGIEPRVHLLGRASPEQIVHLLNGCRALVIPSRGESFGIAALEGLAAGKPVLATRVGGLPALLVGSANRLVEPTVAALAEGLAWLDEAVDGAALAKANRQLAARYTWDRAAASYTDVFASLAGVQS